MQKTLVIMAAGMGSRYGGLKQADHVGPSGELIIDYSIYDAWRAGFSKAVLIVKEENEALFRKLIGDRISKFMDVVYVHQRLDNLPAGYSVPEGRVKPWGTAHAVMSCIDAVHEPFAVINADDFYGRRAFQLLADWMETADFSKTPAEYCMVGYILKNTLTENGYVSRGVCRIDEKTKALLDITERTKIMRSEGRVAFTEDDVHWTPIDKNSVVSMNCWAFPSSFLKEISARFVKFLDAPKSNPLKAEFFLPFVVQDMLREGKCSVKVLPTEEQWFGVTYRTDREAVVRAIARKVEQGEYPPKLWESGETK